MSAVVASQSSRRARRGQLRRRRGVGLGLAACLLLTACHHRVVRWSARGQHERVVQRVSSSRFEAHDEAARAYARSLVALGQVEQARGVLLRDFRHGGHVPSLVALADLEAHDGRWGIATVNYARVVAIESGRLTGREDVCGAFRRRAADLLSLGDAIAADHDMRRVEVLCGEPNELTLREADARTWQAISEQANAQARAQRMLTMAPEDLEPTQASKSSSLPTAPLELRRIARDERRSLTPADVVALLVAEARGQLGLELVDVEELRALVGYAEWSTFAPFVSKLPDPEAAYVRARLAALWSVPGAETTAQREQLFARGLGGGTLDGPGSDYGWRLAALQGGAGVAEIALRRALSSGSAGQPADTTGQARSVAGNEVVADADSLSDQPSGPGTHWALHVPAAAAGRPALRAVARLRAGRRFDGTAVRIGQLAVRHADDQDAREEIRRALALGRPWYALALSAVARPAVVETVLPAIGTAILLQRAVCGETCSEPERDEINVVTAVVGEAELSRLATDAMRGAVARDPALPAADACPTIEQLLAEPQGSALGAVLAVAIAEQSLAGQADTLARILESDPSLVCTGRFVTPLLAAGLYEVTAAVVADRLGMAPELESSVQLELHAELAVVAGQSSRARALTVQAAAISSTPRDVWARAAFFARRLGQRELELEAWRQVLLAGAGDARAEVERFLVVRQLVDLQDDEPSQRLEVSTEAVAIAVRRLVSGAGESSRWWREHDLLEDVADRSWTSVSASRLVAVLVDAGIDPARHPSSWARLESMAMTRPPGGVTRDEPPPADGESGSGTASESMFAGLGPQFDEADVIVPAFVRVDARLVTRLRRLLDDEDTRAESNVGVAVGLAVTGDGYVRAAALQWLLRYAAGRSPQHRAAVLDVLVGGGVALPPDGAPAQRLVTDGDLVYRLALGLDLDALELRATTRAWGSSLSRVRVITSP